MNILGRIFGTIFWPIRMLLELLGRLLPGMSKLTSISLPAKIALSTFLFLTVITITAFVIQLSESSPEKWQTLYIIVPLIFIIPICLYYGIKLLSVKAESRFPDIENAWEEGIESLESQQISLGQTPLFIVLGTQGRMDADALMKAAGVVSEIPPGRDASAPLHWYVSREAIFLVVSNVGVANRLSKLWEAALAPTGASSLPAIPVSNAVQPTGTAVIGSPEPDEQPQPMAAPVSLASAPGGGYGTLEIGAGGSLPSSDRGASSSARAAGLSVSDTKYEEDRMQYLCELLVQARSPVCPVNGMAVLLPFRVVNAAGSELSGALRNDIETVRHFTQLRFPAIAVVSDMELEEGFHELVRRVGPDLARDQRFGKGCHHGSRPTTEHILAVTRHACGAFEDWTYMLFGQSGGLDRHGNNSLFSLLCKVRGKFTDHLVSVLTNSFGFEADQQRLPEDQLLFGGCYFAATGPDADRQAFVRGVFKKLIDLQGDLSWAPAAYDRDEHYQSLSNIALAAGVAGIALAVWMAWFQ